MVNLFIIGRTLLFLCVFKYYPVWILGERLYENREPQMLNWCGKPEQWQIWTPTTPPHFQEPEEPGEPHAPASSGLLSSLTVRLKENFTSTITKQSFSNKTGQDIWEAIWFKANIRVNWNPKMAFTHQFYISVLVCQQLRSSPTQTLISSRSKSAVKGDSWSVQALLDLGPIKHWNQLDFTQVWFHRLF